MSDYHAYLKLDRRIEKATQCPFGKLDEETHRTKCLFSLDRDCCKAATDYDWNFNILACDYITE